MTERYLTTPEIAAVMGISVRTVHRMVAAGMPSEDWGMRCRTFSSVRMLAMGQRAEYRHS